MTHEPPQVPQSLLVEVCTRFGIHHDDYFWVVNMVRQPGAAPACCGSGCDPCVDDVVAAADEIRQRLAQTDS